MDRKTVCIFLIFSLITCFAPHIFPQLFFTYNFNYKAFKLHSHQPISSEISLILDKSDSLLQRSELKQLAWPQHIFVCNGYLEFAFFAVTIPKAFAVNNLFTGNIFIAQADIQKNKALRNDALNAERSFSGVIAHEMTHSLMFQNMNAFTYFNLPTWKIEGYCDFIANESTLNGKAGLDLLCRKKPSESPAFDYFQSRLMVEYLFHEKRNSFSQFIQTKIDPSELTAELKRRYCSE